MKILTAFEQVAVFHGAKWDLWDNLIHEQSPPDAWLHPKEVARYANPDNGSKRWTFKKLKDDIAQNGIKSPIQLHTNGNNAVYISDGHHRNLAAHQLGHDKVPVHITMDSGADPEIDHPIGPGLQQWLTQGNTPREPGWDMEG